VDNFYFTFLENQKKKIEILFSNLVKKKIRRAQPAFIKTSARRSVEERNAVDRISSGSALRKFPM